MLSLGLYVTCMHVWSISPTFDMLQHNNMSVSVAEFFRRKTKQHSFLWLVEKRLWTEKIIYVWSLDLLREKEWDFLQQQKKSSLRGLFSVVIEGWKTLGYTSCSAAPLSYFTQPCFESMCVRCKIGSKITKSLKKNLSECDIGRLIWDISTVFQVMRVTINNIL